MGKSALLLIAASLLLPALSPVMAQDKTSPSGEAKGAEAAGTTIPNHITGYTAWDDDFLYIAIQVTKPALRGSVTLPFTDPRGDDAVIISLQTDDDHKAVQRTAHTVTLAVSEAGGMQLYLGEKATPLFNGLDDLNKREQDIEKNEKDPAVQTAKRLTLFGSLPKIQVAQTGGPRPGAANYPGYTVEIAIPWSDLGGKPEAGAKMGFNAVALSKAEGSPPLQSLNPNVRGQSDIENPSLWAELLFANSAKAQGVGPLVSPRVLTNKPEIDGQLKSGEWNNLAKFDFGERIEAGGGHTSLAATQAARLHPNFTPQMPRPVVMVAAASTDPLPVKPHTPHRVTPLVLARYEYDYQADPRKEAPMQHVVNPDNSSALAHHPLEGTGPWFSYDRADWHRQQLLELRKAGIDVILPIYHGTPRERQLYADKGLLVLASALEYLRRAHQEYPQVGLALDSNALVTMLGDHPDLRDLAAQAALYGIIRDFYRRIPAPFRCTVSLESRDGARVGYPVFLSDASAFKEWDSSFASYVRGRFRADFDGADLVLIGPEAFGLKAGLDSYIAEASAKSGATNAGGWIKTVEVGAGYDIDGAQDFTANAATLRARRNGETYHTDWVAALAMKPDWILVKNWNDYSLGSEVAPSLEEGYSTADMTRIMSRMFGGSEKLHAKFVWNDAPAAVLPQSAFTVQVRVQNAGMAGWGQSGFAQIPVALSYRWRRDGQVVADGPLTSIPGDVVAGAETTVALKVQAGSAKERALPEGDYTLEIGPVEKKGGSGSWFGAESLLQIPITVRSGNGGAPMAATLIDTDLPQMVEAGGVYPVTATLRNDGASVWRKADGIRVTLRLYRLTDGVSATATTPAAFGETPVPTADASALLDQDVPPGQQATVHLLLPLTDPMGKPLPVWTQNTPWTYAVRWEVAADRVAEGAKTVPAAFGGEVPVAATGVSFGLTPLGVVNFDFGARFTLDGTPAMLPGERRQPVLLSIKNVGPQIWKKDSVRVGYHWYYEDGTEFLWEDETTALTADVPPGESVNNLTAYVTAPPCDGNYFLMWDVKFGDTWGSTAAGTRVFDQTVHAVQVIGGHLMFTDLSKAYNLDGITDLDNLTGGDFDGKGRTFPAALIPPFTDDGVVPMAIWQPYDKAGPESPRRISFKWGSKEPKTNNFIACRGQRVELGKSADKCRVLHILAASTDKNVVTNVKLVFQEPTSQSTDLYALSVSRWDQPPAYNEVVAFTSRRHHERSGSQPGAVSLYHYTIVIREPRKLVALELPDEPSIKIAAITLEK